MQTLQLFAADYIIRLHLQEQIVDLLQAIFHPIGVMVMVRIVRIRAMISVTVNVSVNRVTIRMGTENSSCRVCFLYVPDGK